MLCEINWNKELQDKNVDEAMLAFNQKFKIAYSKSFLFKRLSRKRAKDKPWITTGLKGSIKQKHLLYQKFIFDSSEGNRIAYKTFKNNLRSIIRKAKVNYYKNVFNSKTQSIKEMWKELGNLLNTSKKSKGNSISKLIINNQVITKDKDIADQLQKLAKIWPIKLGQKGIIRLKTI